MSDRLGVTSLIGFHEQMLSAGVLSNFTPEVLQVLHPLKPADSNTSPASIYIRAHNDAPVPEDCIPGRRCGTVGGLYHKAAVKLLGHCLGDGIGGGSRDEDITWHAEHLVMRDFAACRKVTCWQADSLTYSIVRSVSRSLTQLLSCLLTRTLTQSPTH